MKSRKGLSLIEVIIAITIIGVIGSVTSIILTRTFRANSQSEEISKLKQNGNLAINSMAETIRKAEGVKCYSQTVPIKALALRTLDGKYVKFRFVDPIPPTGTPTQNGYIIKQENLNPSDETNFCTTVFSSEVPITNRNAASGVSISNGEFKKLSGNVGKDTITIKFDVNPTLNSGGTIEAKIVQMQTTVQIR